MTEIQKDLIRKYLNSSLFPRDNKCADGKKFLKSANNSSNFKLSDEGKYLCAYGGLFGLGSKIKEVAFFTEDRFYIRKSEDSTVTVVRYDAIVRVIYNHGDKYAIVQCDGSNYVVPKFAASAVKGLEVILKTDSSDSKALSQYLISVQEKFLGEYSTIYMTGLFDKYFPKGSVLTSISYRCGLIELDATRAIFEIKIKDKDLEVFTSEEWERGVEEFSTRRDILEKIQEALSSALCMDYPLGGIQFKSRYKKTLLGQLENGAAVASEVLTPVVNVASQIGETVMRDTMIKAADAARRAGDKEAAEYYGSIYRDMYEAKFAADNEAEE